MAVSTHLSRGAPKPTEPQKLASDSAMLVSGVVKPSARTNADDTTGTASDVNQHAGPDDTASNEYEQCEAQNLLKRQTDMLSHRAHEAGVKKLFTDITKLREWQSTTRPTNKQRDAMMKLGSDWHVPQKAHGKKMPPNIVAWNLQTEFMHTAQRLLENKTPFDNKRRATKPAHDDDEVPDDTNEAKREHR